MLFRNACVGIVLLLCALGGRASAQTINLPIPTDLKVSWGYLDADYPRVDEFFVSIDAGRWSVGKPVGTLQVLTVLLPPAARTALSVVGTHVATIIATNAYGESISAPGTVIVRAAPIVGIPPPPPTNVTIICTPVCSAVAVPK
jgi:hypothetical protein